jgi:hypothetical protein
MGQQAALQLIPGFGSMYSAALQDKANRRALQAQITANDDALNFAKELERQRQLEHEQEEAERRAQWEAYEQQRQPYRDAASSILDARMGRPRGSSGQRLSGMLGPTGPSAPKAPGRLSRLGGY